MRFVSALVASLLVVLLVMVGSCAVLPSDPNPGHMFPVSLLVGALSFFVLWPATRCLSERAFAAVERAANASLEVFFFALPFMLTFELILALLPLGHSGDVLATPALLLGLIPGWFVKSWVEREGIK